MTASTTAMQAAKRPDGPPPSHAVASRTLLLVDDESSVLSSLKRLLRREGYNILTASSGVEALTLLESADVGVIVSDQRMPGMTGVDFLRRVKALYPDTIRMTLSGFTDLQSIIDAVNEGAVYKFLMKPWDDERIREHLKAAFAQKEMVDDNRRLQHAVAAANADLADLNRRLEELLSRQREQSELMQASAGSARDLVDALPVGVFCFDPDGVLCYLNKSATTLVPEAAASLGDLPEADLARWFASVRHCVAGEGAPGRVIALAARSYIAWTRDLADQGVARGEVLVLSPLVADGS